MSRSGTPPRHRSWRRRTRRVSVRRTALLAGGAVATAGLLGVAGLLLWRRRARRTHAERRDEALADRNERYAG